MHYLCPNVYCVVTSAQVNPARPESYRCPGCSNTLEPPVKPGERGEPRTAQRDQY